MNDDDRQAARFAVVNELRGINYRLAYWWNQLHPLDEPVVTGIDLDLLREQHVVVPTTTTMPVPSRQQLTAFLTARCNRSVAEVERIQDMNEIVDILRREWESQSGKSECHVTLTQIAAIVNKSKRTLEGKKAKLPPPTVEGGRGKADEWAWSKVRPILEKLFGRQLPEVFPADRFVRR